MRTLPVTRTRRPLRVALGLVVVAVLLGLVALRPDGSRPDAPGGTTSDGRIVAVRSEACPDTAPEARITCSIATVRLEGGTVVETTLEVDARPGERVVVQETATGPAVVAHDRGGSTLVLAAGGVLVLLVVARLHGLRAAVALAAVTAVVVGWGVPGVLDGRSAVGVAAVVGVVVGLALTFVVRSDAGGQVAALASAVVAGAGALAYDVVDSMLFTAPPAHVGGAAVVAAASALVAVDAVDATWALEGVAPDAGWRGIARAGRRGAAVAAGRTTAAVAGVVVATSALSLDPFELDGEPLAAPLAWVVTALLVVPLAAPVASSLAAWVAVREGAGPGADDPRRFRSKGERALWEPDDV